MLLQNLLHYTQHQSAKVPSIASLASFHFFYPSFSSYSNFSSGSFVCPLAWFLKIPQKSEIIQNLSSFLSKHAPSRLHPCFYK